MNARATATGSAPSEWFVSWFDSPHYHHLYVHRDDQEAAGLVDRLIDHVHPPDGAAILDLGCGAGRHSRHLAAKGFDVTGLDLSAESIRQARQSEHAHLRFLRQDMRLPVRGSTFDCVFSLFTSFGYFDDPGDDVTVLHNVAAALRPGGVLVLDYLNVVKAAAHLVPRETLERGGVVYRLSRWSDRSHIFKRIVIDEGTGRPPVTYVERVAKLTRADFAFMLSVCGMALEDAFGDYTLAPFDAAASPRLILIARKAETRPRLRSLSGQVLADAADGFRRHAEVGREH